MKIAIIGAGVMGLSCGLKLSLCPETDVTIYDDPNTPSASQYAGGMLAPYSESDTLPPELQALAFKYSLPFWQKLTEINDIHHNAPGTLVVAHPEDKTLLKRFETHLPQGSYESGVNPQSREPQISPRISDALWVYDEAYLDTAQVLSAIKADLKKSAKWVEKAVTPTELQDYDWVIDARGLSAGIEGLRGIKGERVLLRCPDLNLKHCIRMMHPRYPLYIVPHADDVYMVGASMIEDNDVAGVSVRSTLELLTAFTSLSPLALEAEILSIDAGFRPAFADHLPRIQVEDNIVSCNGLYRHGFLLAPVMAEAVLAFVQKQDTKAFDSLFMEGEEKHAINH